MVRSLGAEEEEDALQMEDVGFLTIAHLLNSLTAAALSVDVPVIHSNCKGLESFCNASDRLTTVGRNCFNNRRRSFEHLAIRFSRRQFFFPADCF